MSLNKTVAYEALWKIMDAAEAFERLRKKSVLSFKRGTKGAVSALALSLNLDGAEALISDLCDALAEEEEERKKEKKAA
jgi:hypothetical protein